MADDIIGIALKWDIRMVPAHPQVERIMQEEIRQEGADDPTLRRASFPCDEASILHLLRGIQPSLDEQKHPRAIGMLADRAHKQIGIDAVEEGLDIKIKNPRMAPASLPRPPDRIERRFVGSISIGVVVEVRLHEWLQETLDHRLGNAIGDRRYSERPGPVVPLRYVHPSHRRRMVAARRHSIP